MPSSPLITFYHEGSTETTGELLTDSNPLVFGGHIPKGAISGYKSIDIWNDRAGGAGSHEAFSVQFNCIEGDSGEDVIFVGTTKNGFKSMLEARSVGAYNTPSDAQDVWTPIGPTDLISIGNMPSNSKKTIQLRMNVPSDAAELLLIEFTPRLQVGNA